MPFTTTLPDEITYSALTDALKEAGEYVAGLQQRRSRGESVDGADLQSGVDFITTIDAAATAFEHVERARIVEESRAARPARTGPTAATGVPSSSTGPDLRSWGQRVTEDPEFEKWLKSGTGVASSGHKEIVVPARSSLRVGQEYRDLITAVNAVDFMPVGQPVVPRPRQRRLFLRDLCAVQRTGLTSVPYVLELNPATNELLASTTAEGGAKNEILMQWTHADAPVRKITAWVPVTEEMINDQLTLGGYIDNRLEYMLDVREEYQLLAGSGTSPDIKGILQFAGIQTQAYTGTDVFGTLGLAIALIENVDGEADGIGMNPIAYWTAVTKRNSTHYDGQAVVGGAVGVAGGSAPFGAPGQYVWGLPVFRSRTFASAKALVGCFGMGATIFDREDATIKIGNQHLDYFTTNKVAIVAEKRLALAVHRPDFFVDTTVG